MHTKRVGLNIASVGLHTDIRAIIDIERVQPHRKARWGDKRLHERNLFAGVELRWIPISNFSSVEVPGGRHDGCFAKT
jgi:hypothetical protein